MDIKVITSDEFELRFPKLRRAEPSRAEKVWDQAEPSYGTKVIYPTYPKH